jgi:hypothetical protein
MLTGAERKTLRDAILAAFDYEPLKQTLAEAQNSRDLGDIVSPEASYDDRGWVQELMQVLLDARSKSVEFVEVVTPIAERAQSPRRRVEIQTRRFGPWIAVGLIALGAVAWFLRVFFLSAVRRWPVEAPTPAT